MEQWKPYVQAKPVRLLAIDDLEATHILKEIFTRCGYQVSHDSGNYEGCDFLLIQPAQIPQCSSGLEYLLLEENHIENFRHLAGAFQYCAVEYEALCEFCGGSFAQTVSYSANDSGADVFAGNIRHTPEGVVFELTSGGVIGRVVIGCRESIRPALLAALTALCCGVPFARIVDTLNQMAEIPINRYYG